MHTTAPARDQVFHALADPRRRAIFESLARGEAAVKDITARFDISQPAVSQHLATLKTPGLVTGRREGRSVYCRVDPRGMKPLESREPPRGVFARERLRIAERALENIDIIGRADVPQHHYRIPLQPAQLRPLHRRLAERCREFLLRHHEQVARERARILPAQHLPRPERRILGQLTREPHVPRTHLLGGVPEMPF